MNPRLFFQQGMQRVRPFIFTIDTSKTVAGGSANNQFRIPLENSLMNFQVHWGDGTSDHITAFNQSEVTHTYSSIGIYQIKIYGRIGVFRFNNGVERLKIKSVEQFGSLILLGNGGLFYGCSNLTAITAPDVLKIGTDSINVMFYNSGITNVSNINLWDLSGVTSALNLFRASPFNSNINSWDVSNFIQTTSMFLSATQFNQPLNSWNVSNIVDMTTMFNQATAFNQDISAWNFNKNVILQNFMQNKTNYNPLFYDALLQKWASVFIGTGRTQTNKNIGMGGNKYTIAGKPYRDALVADGFVITDGGMI